MTEDCQYEDRWQPIIPYALRKEREEAEKKLPFDEEREKRKPVYKFNRYTLDSTIFTEYDDLGEVLYNHKNPNELNKNQKYWEKEHLNTEETRALIPMFKDIAPHDFFEIMPNVYNLSI